jgi:hypothetical protein
VRSAYHNSRRRCGPRLPPQGRRERRGIARATSWPTTCIADLAGTSNGPPGVPQSAESSHPSTIAGLKMCHAAGSSETDTWPATPATQPTRDLYPGRGLGRSGLDEPRRTFVRAEIAPRVRGPGRLRLGVAHELVGTKAEASPQTARRRLPSPPIGRSIDATPKEPQPQSTGSPSNRLSPRQNPPPAPRRAICIRARAPVRAARFAALRIRGLRRQLITTPIPILLWLRLTCRSRRSSRSHPGS